MKESHYSFTNSEGKTIVLPAKTKLKELVRLGCKVEICSNDEKPTRRRFICQT